jgi:Holliday junction resolvase
MSTNYERELKALLSGKGRVLLGKLNDEELAAYKIFSKRPFFVVRATGSFGVADLVALRSSLSFLIEIKSSVHPKFHFSDQERLKKQVKNLKEVCERIEVIPIYAFYLKRQIKGHWRFFSIPLNLHNCKLPPVYDELPKIEETKEGNFVMDWDKGLEMKYFLKILS